MCLIDDIEESRSDAADEVRLLFGHFFVSRQQSQYCDYALETKNG